MATLLQKTSACVLGIITALPVSAAGIVLLDFSGNSEDQLQALRVGSDDQIIASVLTSSDPSLTCGIYALSADGALASSFGTGGRLVPSSCPADFRVLASGSLSLLEAPSPLEHPRVRVRDATGALISTSVEPLPQAPLSNKRRTPTALVVQSDDKTVVGGAGTESTAGMETWRLSRLASDGTLDLGFGGGQVSLDVGGTTQQRIADLHEVPGGKVLASGRNSTPLQTTLVRFNTDGSIDPSFGANGVLHLADGPGVVAIDAQQRIYVPTSDGLVTRLSADGTLDGAYGGGASISGLAVTGIALDTSNRILLFGRLGVGQAAQGFVGRLDANGVPDATFNGTGQKAIDFGRLPPTLADMRCLGGVQQAGLPVLACSVTGEADADQTARTDLAIVRLTTAGVVDATFAATQMNSDTYPDAFSFQPATVPYGTANVVSNAITVSGINAATSIDGTAYSIGCSGSFVSVHGTINPGASVCLRLNALAQPGAVNSSTVLIGGRAATFTVTSGNSPADSTPDPFTFADPTGIATNTLIASNTITIAGITGFATVSVTNGSFSIGCNANTFGPGPDTVTNGATICVRHTTASTASTSTSTTLTVGGVSDTFTTTTAAATPTPPVTPPTTPPSSGGGGSMDLALLALLAACVPIIRRRGLRHILHHRLESIVMRIKPQPFLQDVVRRELGELAQFDGDMQRT